MKTNNTKEFRKNLRKIKKMTGRPTPRLVVWIMRKLAEAERRKWERSPEYDKAVEFTRKIIEEDRELININAGESELNAGR